MTTAQAAIKERVMQWSSADKIHLAEELLESVDEFASPEISKAWEVEIARRVKEIDAGEVVGIPAKQVIEEARKMLRETRRLSSTRRKRTH